MDQVIKVGDVVERKDGSLLRSGAQTYFNVVCVSVDPFTLVSGGADMMWTTTVKPEQFKVVAKCPVDILEQCMKRLEE